MSYLAWPVSINGKIMTPNGVPFHMTLKYFGKSADISVASIRERLRGHDLSPVSYHDKPRWVPDVWNHDGLLTCVLELTNPPERLALARGAFADVRKDDYAEYRPHISVPKFWFAYLNELGPGHVILELGPLALMGLDT